MPADLALRAQGRKLLLTWSQSAPVRDVVGGRLPSIDILRGLVMVLMALDHTRDFFGNGGANPRDVADPALFLTRWITHFCAPTFIFLAGLSAWLYGRHGRTIGDVSRFLLTRGLFLIIIEFTIVRLAWSFALDLDFFGAQVIWVIGASMVVLALLIHLPSSALLAFALLMIAGHNLLDPVKSADLGAIAPVWRILHEPGFIRLGPGIALYGIDPGPFAKLGIALRPALTLKTRIAFLKGVTDGISIGYGGRHVTSRPSCSDRFAMSSTTSTMSDEVIASSHFAWIVDRADTSVSTGAPTSMPAATVACPVRIAVSQAGFVANPRSGRHSWSYSHSPPNSFAIVRV